MDATPKIFQRSGTKVWDFIFGCLLIGAAPLATYSLLATLSDWPCDFVFKHYGNQPAFILQVIALTIATLATVPACVFATFWRKRHRLLPTRLLAFEVIIGLVWAFCFFAFIALCYGPNDAWNQ